MTGDSGRTLGTCQQCGKSFQLRMMGPIPKFCSNACRQAAHRERHGRKMDNTSNHQPARMTPEQIGDLLRDIAHRVEIGDSWEGWVSWYIPDDDSVADTLDVRATFRIGNTKGQGGYRIVGTIT